MKRYFALMLAAATVPTLTHAQDPKDMIQPMVQSFGYTCGQVLHSIPYEGTSQKFDLVCSTNANGSGPELTYVIDLSTGSIVITPK